MKSRALALVSVLAVIAAACSSTPAASPGGSTAASPAPSAATTGAPSTAATSAPSVAPSSTGGSTVVLARPASRTINHLAESSIEGAQNDDLVYESLVQIDGSGKIIPELATSWEPSADFKTWTFELRPGVKFHDGTPFNAQAVKFNYDRILRVPGQSGGAWTDYADANTVEVVDDDTVVFNLTKPFPGLITDMLYIRYKIASPTFIQEHMTSADPEAMEFLATNASGTGPFKLVEFVPDQRVVFEKNDDYWGGEPGGRAMPKVDGVTFQIIKDPDSARIELEAGRVDIIESPLPAQFDALRAAPGVTVAGYKIPRIAYLTFDVSKPPFDDVKIRQAVAHAVNYQELMDSGELGTAFPLCGMIPDGLMEAIPQNPALCLYPYDVARAKALMAESRQPNGFTVDLTYAPERNGGFPVEAQLLQAYLAEIGITANIQPLDAVAQVAKMAEGAYGIALFVWNAGIPDADDTAGWLYDQSRLPTNESWVGSFWDDAQVQGDMKKARELTDLDQRVALYKAADEKAMAEAIYVPLFQGSKVYAFRDTIKNLDYTVFRRANLWDVEKTQ
jgi:peptide/nickel transport system substrate-binding protein